MALYELDKNNRRGFRTAVESGQVRLALEYAVGVIDDLRAEVDVLKSSGCTCTPAVVSNHLNQVPEAIIPEAVVPRKTKVVSPEI